MSRLVGIDFGDKRVGLAISDEGESMAFPRETLTVSGTLKETARQVGDFVRRESAIAVVVGLPLELDGKRGRQADRVASFLDLLKRDLGETIRVSLLDERFTSLQAQSSLAEAGVPGRKRKGKIDMLAAAIILQEYLDVKRSKAALESPAGGDEEC